MPTAEILRSRTKSHHATASATAATACPSTPTPSEGAVTTSTGVSVATHIARLLQDILVLALAVFETLHFKLSVLALGLSITSEIGSIAATTSPSATAPSESAFACSSDLAVILVRGLLSTTATASEPSTTAPSEGAHAARGTQRPASHENNSGLALDNLEPLPLVETIAVAANPVVLICTVLLFRPSQK